MKSPSVSVIDGISSNYFDFKYKHRIFKVCDLLTAGVPLEKWASFVEDTSVVVFVIDSSCIPPEDQLLEEVLKLVKDTEKAKQYQDFSVLMVLTKADQAGVSPIDIVILKILASKVALRTKREVRFITTNSCDKSRFERVYSTCIDLCRNKLS